VRETRIGAYANDRLARDHCEVEMSVCANPLARPPEVDRILLVRLGSVGDVARTLPAAFALRTAFPGAQLAWLVEPASQGLVAGQPWIDDVLVFPRSELEASMRRGRWLHAARTLVRFVRGLRRRRFDLALDFHSIARSALLARASGAPVRVGYAPPFGREVSWWLATARARLAPRRVSRFARNLGLVEYLGVDSPPRPSPFRIDAETRRRMADALGGGEAPVALHPGTSPATPHKRWSAARYAAVARALGEAGLSCIVTFGPDAAERALAEAVAEQAGGAARLAPVTASLGELAALLESCRLLIASDSGPLHLAALVGTPVVQLVGPTDPVENAPQPGTPARMVRVPVACSPCRRGCAAAVCMRRIAPEDVLAAARELLATPVRGW
jgi:ADP-heptose:LPS heptosyltransferase